MEAQIELVAFSHDKMSFELIPDPRQPCDVLVQALLDGEEVGTAVVPGTTPAELAAVLRSQASHQDNVFRIVTAMGIDALRRAS